MIPGNISFDSVRKAFEDIDEDGILTDRHYIKGGLINNGKLYHPKKVIYRANKFESVEKWEHEHFSGGLEGVKLGTPKHTDDDKNLLSNIIKTLNDTYGIELIDDDKIDIGRMHEKLHDGMIYGR